MFKLLDLVEFTFPYNNSEFLPHPNSFPCRTKKQQWETYFEKQDQSTTTMKFIATNETPGRLKSWWQPMKNQYCKWNMNNWNRTKTSMKDIEIAAREKPNQRKIQRKPSQINEQRLQNQWNKDTGNQWKTLQTNEEPSINTIKVRVSMTNPWSNHIKTMLKTLKNPCKQRKSNATRRRSTWKMKTIKNPGRSPKRSCIDLVGVNWVVDLEVRILCAELWRSDLKANLLRPSQQLCGGVRVVALHQRFLFNVRRFLNHCGHEVASPYG